MPEQQTIKLWSQMKQLTEWAGLPSFSRRTERHKRFRTTAAFLKKIGIGFGNQDLTSTGNKEAKGAKATKLTNQLNQ
jgi:hypothetical protein